MEMRSFVVALVLVAGCASGVDTVAVPGTKFRFQMVRVDGKGAVPSFWMEARETTWREFDCFLESPSEEAQDGVTRPSRGKDYIMLSGLAPEWMQPEKPVTNLRYHAAASYCEWLSKRTGATYRLPTEAEWDLAAAEPGEIRDLNGGVWEYCLESDRPPELRPVLKGGAWNEPGLLRRTDFADWSLADPNRPLSTWWFRAGHAQGLRVVRVSEPDEKPARDAAAAKLRIQGLKGVESDKELFVRVSGTVENGGDRALSELVLKVYYLNPKGKPHFEDVSSYQTRRATFNLALPVLANTPPLKPGEARAFAVDLPLSLDGDDEVNRDRFSASVLSIRFAD